MTTPRTPAAAGHLLASRAFCVVRGVSGVALQAERTEVWIEVAARGHHTTQVNHQLRAPDDGPVDLMWNAALAPLDAANTGRIVVLDGGNERSRRLHRRVPPGATVEGRLAHSGHLPVSLATETLEPWTVDGHVAVDIAAAELPVLIEVGPYGFEVVSASSETVVLALRDPSALFTQGHSLMVDVRSLTSGPCTTAVELASELDALAASVRMAGELVESPSLVRAVEALDSTAALLAMMRRHEDERHARWDAPSREGIAECAHRELARWREIAGQLAALVVPQAQVTWRAPRPDGLEVRPWSGPDPARLLASLERLAAPGAPSSSPEADAARRARIETGALRPPAEPPALDLDEPWSALAVDQLRLDGRSGAVLVPRATRITISSLTDAFELEHDVVLPDDGASHDVTWLAPPSGSNWRAVSATWRDAAGEILVEHSRHAGPIEALNVQGVPMGTSLRLTASVRRLLNGPRRGLLPLAFEGRAFEPDRADEVSGAVPRFAGDDAARHWPVEVVYRSGMAFDWWLTRIEAGPVPVTVLSNTFNDHRLAFGEPGQRCTHDPVIQISSSGGPFGTGPGRETLADRLAWLRWRVSRLLNGVAAELQMASPDPSESGEETARETRRAVLELTAMYLARWQAARRDESQSPDIIEARIVLECQWLLATSCVARARALGARPCGAVHDRGGEAGADVPIVAWQRDEHLPVIEALEHIAEQWFVAAEPWSPSKVERRAFHARCRALIDSGRHEEARALLRERRRAEGRPESGPWEREDF